MGNKVALILTSDHWCKFLFFLPYLDKSQFSENFFWNCEEACQQVRLSYGFQLHTQNGNIIRSILACNTSSRPFIMAYRCFRAIRSVKSMPSATGNLVSASGSSYHKDVLIFIHWHVWSSHGKVLCMWNKVWKGFSFPGNSSPDSEETFPLAEASFPLYGRCFPKTRPPAPSLPPCAPSQRSSFTPWTRPTGVYKFN